jgi:DNA modification methylase
MEMIDIKKIKGNDVNPRLIKDEKFKKLVQSIKDFPEMMEVRPIVVNKEMVVLGGNMRLKACLHAGLKKVPIDVVDWSEEKQSEFIIKDNASFGEWDWDILANQWDSVQLDEWGLDVWQDEPQEVDAQEDNYKEPDNLKVDIVLGDLIEIGKHRLLCGDSTDSDQVAKLMNGEMIDMVFTSPPYNSGGNSGTGGYRGNNKRKTKDFYNDQEKSDNWSKEDYFNFCISILNNVSINCNDNTSVLWNVMYNANSRDDYGKIIFSDLNPFTVKETIIWDKGVGMNICSTGILSRTCELVFLLSKGDKYYTNQNNDTYWNTWRISNRQGENMKWGHGASFPIALPFEGIEKFSKEGFNVYEPFTGSGTTMVASHQLKRKCYGMELDPKYCQVVIDRMKQLDPNIEIKINGKIYEHTKGSNGSST